MVHSIKTEIIYYGIPTDFEFEFNLCGSCQMRLLTDSVSDNNALLKSLQRSISRSRVIIVVGTITGENNIIKLISKAIGYDCEILDTSLYQINSTEPIEIIKNAVPLITDDSIFGGCIIESGPQSMIFLSEDKKIRKNIMNSLVHPYLADLSKYPAQAASTAENEMAQTEIASQTNEEAEMPTDTLNKEAPFKTTDADPVLEPPTVEEDLQEPAPLVDDGDASAEASSAAPMVFEDFSTHSSEAPTPSDNDVFNINNLPTVNNIDLNDVDDVFTEEDDEFYSPKRDRKNTTGLNIFTLILAVVLLLLLIFIVYGFVYTPLSNGISITENFKNVFGFLTGN